MKTWVVVAASCSDCNSIGAAAFDHKPSDEDVKAVKGHIGGMYCITEHVLELELNGAPAEEALHS